MQEFVRMVEAEKEKVSMSVAQDDTFNLQNGFLSLSYVCLWACYHLTSIAKNASLVSWVPFKIAYFMINLKTIRLNST